MDHKNEVKLIHACLALNENMPIESVAQIAEIYKDSYATDPRLNQYVYDRLIRSMSDRLIQIMFCPLLAVARSTTSSLINYCIIDVTHLCRSQDKQRIMCLSIGWHKYTRKTRNYKIGRTYPPFIMSAPFHSNRYINYGDYDLNGPYALLHNNIVKEAIDHFKLVYLSPRTSRPLTYNFPDFTRLTTLDRVINVQNWDKLLCDSNEILKSNNMSTENKALSPTISVVVITEVNQRLKQTTYAFELDLNQYPTTDYRDLQLSYIDHVRNFDIATIAQADTFHAMNTNSCRVIRLMCNGRIHNSFYMVYRDQINEPLWQRLFSEITEHMIKHPTIRR